MVHFLDALKACSRFKDLERGKLIHASLVKHGTISDVRLASALLSMYARCGSMLDAWNVFEAMRQHDVVAWSALILGYADNGQAGLAIELFARMVKEDFVPNSQTFVAVLKACGCCGSSQEGMQRGMAIQSNTASTNWNIYIENTLIDTYAKCGHMNFSRRIFEQMHHRDAVSWNALITGYADNGESRRAVELFFQVQSEPSSLTFVAALKACVNLAVANESENLWLLGKGLEIHKRAAEKGCDTDMRVASSLLEMYAKVGSMDKARTFFKTLRQLDVVCWNALICGYVDSGESQTALDLFQRMRHEGFSPDTLTYLAVLKACCSLANQDEARPLEKVIAIHSEALASGTGNDLCIASALISAYSRCGSLETAVAIFGGMSYRDVVAWTSIIQGHADNGEGKVALELFCRMRCEGSCVPNSLTYAAVVKACTITGAAERGKLIHAEIRASGLENSPQVASSLIDFYGRCCSMSEARGFFLEIQPTKDLFVWNALLVGYSRHNDVEQILQVFKTMQEAQVHPNGVSLLCLLAACNHRGLVEQGKELFDSMQFKYGIQPELQHYNCMVDILGRANRVDDAMKLVQSMPYTPNVTTWMCILAACSRLSNVDVGKVAFDSVMKLDSKNARACVLMSNIYKCIIPSSMTI